MYTNVMLTKMEGKLAQDSRNDDLKKACLIRNQNEKKRRDRLNSLVNELCADLPAISDKKLSKNNVLKYATEYFRQEKLASRTENNSLRRIYGSWQPEFLTNEEFCVTMNIGLDEFLLVLNPTGKIVFVTYNIFSILGYDAELMVNTSILDYVHVNDHGVIFSLLNALNHNGSESLPHQSPSFSCHFRRGPQMPGTEFVRCVSGIFRAIDTGENESDNSNYSLVLLCRLAIHPFPNRAIVVAGNSVPKFTARLNSSWTFECVERAATLTVGYYPIEMLGTGLYEYCHADDLENLAEYHSMLLYSGVITTCYYRFLTKGQIWLWVRSRCHVSYSQLDSKPESVICMTWPIKASEFREDQAEILQRDRQVFSQILKEHQKRRIPPTTSNTCSKSRDGTRIDVQVTTRPLSSNSTEDLVWQQTPQNLSVSSYHDYEATNFSQLSQSTGSSSGLSVSSVTSDTSSMFSSTTVDGQTPSRPWHLDSHVDAVSVWAPLDSDGKSSKAVESSNPNNCDPALILEENLDLPNSFSFSQWALHVHLREQYKHLTESIRQQSEQITVIQKQLSIQRELSSLSDQLEIQENRREQRLQNTFEETKQMIRQKLIELREASNGPFSEIGMSNCAPRSLSSQVHM